MGVGVGSSKAEPISGSRSRAAWTAGHSLHCHKRRENLEMKCIPHFIVQQWSSTCLTLRPFSSRPHVVVTSTHKTILFLLYNCDFATVMNGDVNTWYSGYLICDPRGVRTQRLRTTV